MFVAVLNWSMPTGLMSLRYRLEKTLSPRLRGTLSLSVPVFCTLTIFAAWSFTRIVVNQARDWVDHTENVIISVDQVHFKMLQLESNLRRHAITDSQKSPARYQQNRQEILQLSALINRKISDNSAQQARWRDIQALLDTRFRYLSQLLAIQQQDVNPNGQLVPILTEGERVMQTLRQALEQFRNQERSLLAEREQKLDMILSVSVIAGWGLLLGSLMSSFTAVYLFRGLDSAHADQGLELQQSQQMMQAIADSVVDGVITLDSAGKVVQFNRSAQDMFGYDGPKRNSLVVTELLDLQPTELRAKAQESDHHVFETLGTRQDGTTFPIEASVSQISVNDQQFLIIRDISERRDAQTSLENYAGELEHLNQILSLANQALTQRNEELGQFAYLASHDLKAPLRAITNLSTWIEEELDDQLSGESQKLFILLRGRANRLEKLIDALAHYVQLGQQPLENSAVDVGEMVQSIIANHPGSKDFTVKLPAQWPIIQTHQKYLAEVFRQLIDNAIQFHPTQSGMIQVEVQELETGWQFSVMDNGNGIEPKYHDRIFGVFQTLQARDQQETTGIGLAIVTKILQIVGGQIKVISSLGSGATFQFIWPK